MGAPKGQQLTAQGTALGFCVGVGFSRCKCKSFCPNILFIKNLRIREFFVA